MRRMRTHQAIQALARLLVFLMVLCACAPLTEPTHTVTSLPPAPSPSRPPTLIPSPLPTGTITPLPCLRQPGRLEAGALDTTNPPQRFLVYLPPCYDQKTDQRYPVLYLLHGQTYTEDQWIRLGAVDVMDRLILSGESIPFIIVFPDDRYWNLPPGPGFGQRLVEDIVPYIDLTYRTLPDRDHRAIGGMSRGAGWALELGLKRWDLFGTIGLHSLAVLQGDTSEIRPWLAAIPPASRPRVFMDIGDNDQELEMAEAVEAQFTTYALDHEWHLYSGAHTELYWSAHIEEYMRWYAKGWNHP